MTQEQLDELIATGQLKRLERLSCIVANKPKYLVLSFSAPYWAIDIFDSTGSYTMETEHYTNHKGVYQAFERFLKVYNRKFTELFEEANFDLENPISTQVLTGMVKSRGNYGT